MKKPCAVNVVSSILVVILFFVSQKIVFPTLAFSGGGNGSSESPYRISTCLQLQEINDSLSSEYILTQNIDCSETSTWNGGQGFVPIGSPATPFEGVLDGNDFSISDLSIVHVQSGDGINGGNIGIFSAVDNADIRDLYIEDINIAALNYQEVGGLAGTVGLRSFPGSEGPSNISNVHLLSGTIQGHTRVGGLIGEVYNSLDNISNSSSAVNVTALGNDIGGFVGVNLGNIRNSYASGDVYTETYDAGGFVGLFSISIDDVYASIERCYATGNVTGDDDVGGFVGFMTTFGSHNVDSSLISDSYSVGNVTENNVYRDGISFGGFVGEISTGTIENSYSVGIVDSGDPAESSGGFSGSLSAGNADIINSFWDTETSGYDTSDGGSGKTTLAMKNSSTFTDATWNFNNIWNINATKNNGYPILGFSGNGRGFSIDPYQITSCEELQEIRYGLSSSYIISNDIDCVGDVWTPIGVNPGASFMGFLDGNNQVVSNISVDYIGGGSFAGFFGSIDGGTVQDLTINNIDISAPGYGMVGGLVGAMGLANTFDSEITNVTVSGDISGGAQTGGLIGLANRLTDSIVDSSANVDVLGDSQVGGLVGSNYADIDDCSTSGTVNGTGNYVGGLVGYAFDESDIVNSEIFNCHSSSDVNSTGMRVGGLVGGTTMRISTSYATGDVTATGIDTGGLVGVVFNTADYSTDNMTGLYATGDVSSEETGVGGLFGTMYANGISNSYATGDVSGLDGYVGGLIGYAGSDSGIINNCHATGDVHGEIASANGRAGGLIGAGEYITNSYATGNVVGLMNFVGGLAGIVYEDVSGSYATGSVESNGDNMGGLIGGAYGAVENCHSSGNVINTGDGNEGIGGLLGSAYVSITNSYATGDITVNGVGASERYIGGLAGEAYLESFVNNYATGDVQALGATEVGGLIGYIPTGIVEKSYALGNVSGKDNVGGLIGKRSSDETINTYALGNVSATGIAGGLIGLNASDVINSYSKGLVSGVTTGGLIGITEPSSSPVYTSVYYNSETSGQSDISKGVPITNSQMGTEATYIGWDFDHTWTLGINLSILSNPSGGGILGAVGDYFDVPTFVNQIKSATVTASPTSLYDFVNWTENGSVLGTTNTYTFSYDDGEEVRVLTANFHLSYLAPRDDVIIDDIIHDIQENEIPEETIIDDVEEDLIIKDNTEYEVPQVEEDPVEERTIREILAVWIKQAEKSIKEFTISEEVAQDISAATLAIVAVSPAVSVGLGSTSMIAYIARFFSGIFAALGLGRKKRNCGMVYNSVTKEPLPNAIVRIYQVDGTLVSTEITNVYGIFETTIEDGQYSIQVQANSYLFPSLLIVGNEDFPYKNVYNGGIFNYVSSSTLSYSIPVDPLDQSMTEYAGAIARNRIIKFVSVLINILVFVGLVFSVMSYVKDNSPINLILLLTYIFFIILGMIMRRQEKYRFGIVTNFMGEPQMGVEIGLMEMEFNTMYAKRVTGEKGKYRFIVPGGQYKLVSLDPKYVLEQDEIVNGESKKMMVISKNITIERKT